VSPCHSLLSKTRHVIRHSRCSPQDTTMHSPASMEIRVSSNQCQSFATLVWWWMLRARDLYAALYSFYYSRILRYARHRLGRGVVASLLNSSRHLYCTRRSADLLAQTLGAENASRGCSSRYRTSTARSRDVGAQRLPLAPSNTQRMQCKLCPLVHEASVGMELKDIGNLMVASTADVVSESPRQSSNSADYISRQTWRQSVHRQSLRSVEPFADRTETYVLRSEIPKGAM